jgi:DNA-binding winged helix-turn-helix (wHTH) protein/tetratricopeptide (TPR) repeat protein
LNDFVSKLAISEGTAAAIQCSGSQRHDRPLNDRGRCGISRSDNNETVMQEKVYRFGRCELRIASREVVVDGTVQLVEPKVFDVLVYLIEQRERVVSKDELLDRIWKNHFVSVGVIARAMMKARQAIGDSAKPALIVTVTRVGYRFIGELEAPAAGDLQEPASGIESLGQLGTPAPVAIQPNTVALALLPFENQTGQPELDWIELGLMSMVVKALSADSRLHTPSISSLLTALSTLPAHATSQEREDVVRRLLGVKHVVLVSITQKDDQYVLDCTIDSSLNAVRKRMLGPELTQLGQRLAQEVEAALFSEDRAPVPVAYESMDPLVNRALARALQAVGEQKYQVAINLFQVVLDIEPLNTEARLEHLRALAPLGNDEAFPLAEQLLAQAEADDDPWLAAATHGALGVAYRSKSQYAAARKSLTEALRLADTNGLADEKASALNRLAAAAILECDFVSGSKLLDEAQRVIEPNRNQIEQMKVLGNAALVAARLGTPVRSLELGHKAAVISKECGLVDHFGAVSMNLVYPCVALGLMQKALKHGEDGVAALQSSGNQYRMALAVDTLCWLYRELRAPEQSSRVLAVVQTSDDGIPSRRASFLQAQSHHAACERDHVRAVECLRQAIAIHREARGWLYALEATPWLVISLVLSGKTNEALHACVEAQALPGFSDAPDLRASLKYCQALVVHSRGEREDSRFGLGEVVDTAPMGVWRAYASLDAAWLAIEAGDVAMAEKMLRDLGTWLEEHPAGMVVDARFKYATGQYVAAHDAHQRYTATIKSAVPVYYAELGSIYADAARRAPASPALVPLTPWLPCTM